MTPERFGRQQRSLAVRPLNGIRFSFFMEYKMPGTELKIHHAGGMYHMKEKFLLLFLAALPVIMPASTALGSSTGFADIRPELEAVLSELSTNLDAFDDLQLNMDKSAKANANYNQQKNIFLSSMLAINTISAVCQYERDLLTLFIDLRAKNRVKFYDVRIQSLETSVRQIENMYRQIQINYTIFPPNFFEAPVIRKERLTIQSCIDLLNRCRELLISVQQR
jgi:hypothetical protein